ncbi:MAG: hypothetical protein Fur0012_03650 [Elusimicrobiota bacterium]
MRKVALAIIRKKDKYLVEKFRDEFPAVYFYKLMGGGIEDGESPQKALCREIKEELKSDITILSKLLICEDSFTYLGIRREIKAYIMEARFNNERDYEFTQKFVYSPQGDFLSIAMWKTLSEIKEEGLVLYPRPLKEKLMKGKNS